jgi:signal transduction histidine kinase
LDEQEKLVNRIVFECLDAALSSFNFGEKNVFYDYLKRQYGLDDNSFAANFQTIHEALRAEYGLKHYRIEREMVRILHERAKKGIYERSVEISAFSCMVTVFMNESKEDLEKIASYNNVTKHARELEVKVKDIEGKLNFAERMAAIGETAAMVGHDIRNPLQSIVGELYLQKEDLTGLPDGEAKRNLRESIRAIEENVFYIDKIVSDLQDYAKPIRIERRKVDVNQVISDALCLVPIPDNLKVEIYIEDNFPCLNGDHQMLQRALINLLNNAVQAMPSGGVLTISASVKFDKAEIIVEDTGVGIPNEIKDQLFKPLVTTKSKGQGLGLAVVKRLVEAQGGTVTFESEKWRGARFIILLPLEPNSRENRNAPNLK